MNTITAPAAHKFFPAIGKNGKVSATAEKIAMTLNSVNRDGLTALARDGKGTIGVQARAVILGGAFGLPQLRVAESLNRDQWGNALALLVGEYGPQAFNRSTMRGRAGCSLYLQAVERAALVRFDGAETVVAQDRAMKAVNAVRADLAHIQRLIAVVEAEIMAERAAGIIAPAVDAAPVDAAPVDAPVGTPGAAWGWKAPAGGIARLADFPVTAPVDAAPVDAAPVDAAPVDAAPVDAAPVDAAPVDAAPVDAAPVKKTRAKKAPAVEALA